MMAKNISCMRKYYKFSGKKLEKIHDLSPLATATFGRLLTITSIMAQEMKNSSDKLTIQIKGSGTIGTMLTTANNFQE